MSLCTQALSAKYIVNNHSRLDNKVYKVPKEIDNYVAELKLKELGVSIDRLTEEQKRYLNSWK